MTVRARAAEAARGGLVPFSLLACAACLVVSAALLVALERGTKWGLAVVAACLACGALAAARDRRAIAALWVAACVPIGIQYGLWSHGGRYETYDHFGGAPAQPILHLVDLPLLLFVLLWLVDLGLERRRLPAWTGVDTAIGVVLLLSLASVISTDEHALLFFEMARYAKYLLLFWAVRTCIDGRTWIWGFAAVQMGVVALQGVLALAQYFFYVTLPLPVGGVSESAFEIMGGEIIQRVTGFLGHSNTFAAYLLVPIALALLLLVTRVSPWRRLAVLPSLGLALAALVLTFSRNGLLSLGVLVLMVAAIAVATGRVSRRAPLLAMALGLVVVMLVLGFGVDQVALRSWGLLGDTHASGVVGTVFTRIAYDPGKAVESRIDLLRISWEMIRKHPLTGIGLNSFEETMALYDRAGTVHVVHQPVHNVFALIAAETGVPSLIAFLALGFLLLRRSWRLMRAGGEPAFLVGALGLTSIVVLAFSNQIDLTLRKEPLLGLMTLIAALVVSMSERSPGDVGRRAQASGL